MVSGPRLAMHLYGHTALVDLEVSLFKSLSSTLSAFDQAFVEVSYSSLLKGQLI